MRLSDISLEVEGRRALQHGAKKFWRLVLKTEKVQSHSSSIFTEDVGAGAIFEMSRILTTFTMIFGRISHTFNPSTVIGGTSINFDEMQSKVRIW
jgi:glutamate carboxypeptidase